LFDLAEGAPWPHPEAEALTRAKRPDLWAIKLNQKRPKSTTDG
jgi:tRNA (guanine37-N1)-methyltransferase